MRDRRHLNSIFLMMDGNFKLINLEKKNNKLDESLWAGRGYFRSRSDVDAHMEKHYDLKVEVSGILNR